MWLPRFSSVRAPTSNVHFMSAAGGHPARPVNLVDQTIQFSCKFKGRAIGKVHKVAKKDSLKELAIA